jgi:hypothetical protein
MPADFTAVRRGQLPYAEAIRGLDRAALVTLTADSYHAVGEIVAGVTDAGVIAVPFDSSLDDRHVGEEAWTLGHVVAHLTATSEAAAALAATLARGVTLPAGLHLRAEVPWRDVATAQQLTARLVESRRICLAFLDTWPDVPHLELTVTLTPAYGPLHAVGIHALGLMHADEHLTQLRQIMRQMRNQGHAREVGQQPLLRSRPTAVRSGGS